MMSQDFLRIPAQYRLILSLTTLRSASDICFRPMAARQPWHVA